MRVALCAAAGAGRCLEAGQGGNLSWEELKTAAWVSGVCVRVRVCVFPVTLVWVMSKENHCEDCKRVVRRPRRQVGLSFLGFGRDT